MKFEKKVIGKVDICYSVSETTLNGKKNLLYATEGHGGCYLYNIENQKNETVWDGPGGTLGLVEIPGKNGDFLAISNFFPVFQAKEAEIVWVHRNGPDDFKVTKILDIPYIHRFCVLTIEGVNYLLAATLCTDKDEIDDWSKPGEIKVGVLPNSPKIMEMQVLMEGLTKNHGFWKGTLDGKEVVLVSCDEGVFAIYPPKARDELWKIRPLIGDATGDIAVADIDNDGFDEIIAIEKFHGDKLKIYKRCGANYEVMWECPEITEFGHALWGGTIGGSPVFLCGHRGGEKALFAIRYVDGEFQKEIIDVGQEPSNIHVFTYEGKEEILVSNRGVGEAAVYTPA